MFPLATVTLTSNGGISFSNIPQTFTHLQIRYSAKTVHVGSFDEVYIRFNSDFTAGNYVSHILQASGSTIASTVQGISPTLNYMLNGDCPTTVQNAALFGAGVIDIFNYSSSTRTKTVRSYSGVDANGSGFESIRTNLWTQTAAITEIQFSGVQQFMATGSTATLYGLYASNATGA